MGTLIPKIVITGLGAAVSPVAIMALISVMMKKKPLKNSLFFLMGFTLVLLAGGILAVFVLHLGGSGSKTALDAWLDISFGALCLVLIPLALRKKPKAADAVEHGELSAGKAFSFGMVMMLANSSTWVIYLAGMHIISAAHLGLPDDAVAVAVLTFTTLLSLLVPIGMRAVFPKAADKMLDDMRVWLSAHQRAIGVSILLIFAILLITKGIRILA